MKSEKTDTTDATIQPQPFTPGLSKTEVRQHAFRLFRDKLKIHGLSLEDWVLAEKDLVTTLQTEGSTGEQQEGR
jgi:hypothetical protein